MVVLLFVAQGQDWKGHVFEGLWVKTQGQAQSSGSYLIIQRENTKELRPVHTKNGNYISVHTRFIPGSLLPRPRPLPDEVDISISCGGISEILVRNTFSSASAIKTMSSPGCRGRHIPLTTCPITPLQSIVIDGSRNVKYLIVNVAVSKHGVEVLNTFLGIDVVTVL